VLLLQGNLSAAATLAAAQVATARGARVLLNTAPLRWDVAPLLPLCAVVVANAGEAEAITGLTAQRRPRHCTAPAPPWRW
jgi:ribokinase